MKPAIRAGLVVALAGMLMTPMDPASAGSDTPDVRWKLRFVSLDPYTGDVTVKARARCSGEGTASWTAVAVQDVRARGTAQITCDGQGRRSKVILSSDKGAFRHGPVSLDIAVVACSTTACTVSGQSFTTTI